MKAILRDGAFIGFASDDAATAPEATYAWSDVAAPAVSPSQIAIPGIGSDPQTMTAWRTWTVRDKTPEELRVSWSPGDWLARFTDPELNHMRDSRFGLLIAALSAPILSNDAQPVLDLLDALIADEAITVNRRDQLLT